MGRLQEMLEMDNSFSCYEGDFYEYTVNGKEDIQSHICWIEELQIIRFLCNRRSQSSAED